MKGMIPVPNQCQWWINPVIPNYSKPRVADVQLLIGSNCIGKIANISVKTQLKSVLP